MMVPPPNSDRRGSLRIASNVPVRVTTILGVVWWGECINVSDEGALVKLNAEVPADPEVWFELDPQLENAAAPVRSRVVRATSPDGRRSFLALQFLGVE